MPDLPRGTVTFLFTDIAGSTRLWQAHSATMPAAYARHDTILREACAAQGGVVYKTIGDAFQVAFPTAPEAVAAALAAQRTLQAEAWSTPEPLRVRMALHTGAVDPDLDGDYRSPVLNRLGRLLGAGHGGQVLLSLATEELARDHLSAGVHLRDLGEQRLKDLFRPERVYQLGAPGLTVDFPPLRTLDARPNNLPLQPTPFIGREQVVADARSVLSHPEVRLLTLTGPGGMGKTRLGLQVAADLLDTFNDGVFVVELAALTDPALVPSAISTVLGVHEEAGAALTERLHTFLRDKHLLLVLDNVEQIIEAASFVGELLAGCRGLKVLATSRIRLGLRGERDFVIPPLALPDPRRLPSVVHLAQYDAVRLFVERAVEATSGFAVTNENAPAVAGICVRLDGLPLAIELAAARVRMLPPAAMLRRLQNRLPLLTGGARDLPERQRTLRGAIAWSYELLTPDEQALFRRLSVFAGGATLEAIEAVAAGDELGFDVFDGLERLVDHSLVRQVETAGEPRFFMLETIREYGLEQLGASAEAEEGRQRHAAFFLALAEAVEPGLMGGPEQGVWLDRLEVEHDNLRAALGWTLDRDAESALRLAGALGQFWVTRGYLTEGRSWVDQALAGIDDVPAAVRAKALHSAGPLASYQGDFVVAKARYEESLILARKLGDVEWIADALNGLGTVALAEGDLDRAVALWEETLTLYRETGDERGMTMASTNLGITVARQGDLDRATTLIAESLALNRRRGNEYGASYDLINLGQLVVARQAWTEAASLFRDGLTTTAELGLREAIVAEGLAGLGAVAAAAGQLARGARLFGAADGFVKSISGFLDLVLPALHERAVAETRAALGEAAFAHACAAGAALSLEEAIAEALAVAAEIIGGGTSSVP